MSLIEQAGRAYRAQSLLNLRKKVTRLTSDLQVALNLRVKLIPHHISEKGRIYIESLGFDLGTDDDLVAYVYCSHQPFGYRNKPIKTQHGAVKLSRDPGAVDQNYALIGEAISRIPCEDCTQELQEKDTAA